MGLYNTFISKAISIDAAMKFNNVWYEAQGGARVYGNEMTRYAARMAFPPTDYEVCSRSLTGLPKSIREEMIQKRGSRPDSAPLEDLIKAVTRIENSRKFEEKNGYG